MPIQPLSGIRVLDISQVMAGPFCCLLLGDMGADVIKVEPPKTGDSTRHSMGFRLKGEDSPGFLALNRNKRSLVLDLKQAEGIASLKKPVWVTFEQEANQKDKVGQREIDKEFVAAWRHLST